MTQSASRSQEAIIKTKRRSQAHQSKLKHNQPQPARDQESRQVSPVLASCKLQIRAGAGQENEHRSAVMCNPAGKEESSIGSGEVSGIKLESSGMHEVARVIEHHHYHDKPAQQIDRWIRRTRPSRLRFCCATFPSPNLEGIEPESYGVRSSTSTTDSPVITTSPL